MKTRLILLAAFSIVLLSSCQKEIVIEAETKTEVLAQPTWQYDDAAVGTPHDVVD